MLSRDLLDPFPGSSLGHVRARPPVLVLGVEARVKVQRTRPGQPSLRLDQLVYLRLHDDRPGVALPRPTEVGWVLVHDRNVFWVAHDGGVHEDYC